MPSPPIAFGGVSRRLRCSTRLLTAMMINLFL
jgi:hypothetical protein